LIEKKYFHQGEINKLRINEKKKNLVATKSVSGAIYIYDIETDVNLKN
jgi:hypothetical protein